GWVTGERGRHGAASVMTMAAAGLASGRQAILWVRSLARSPPSTARGLAICMINLTKLKSVNRVRARAALRWRPKFLAALAIGRTMVFACKKANVAYNTAKYHRAQDRQFAEQ